MKVKGMMLVISGLALAAGLTACNNDSKKDNKQGAQVSVLCRNQRGFEPGVIHYGQRNGRLVAFDARGNMYVLTDIEAREGRMIDQCGRNLVYPRYFRTRDRGGNYGRGRHVRRQRDIRPDNQFQGGDGYDSQNGYDQNYYDKAQGQGDGEDYGGDTGDQGDVPPPDLK